jgi:dTDP-4-amino-4,6-dideoxygalactose transaminase
MLRGMNPRQPSPLFQGPANAGKHAIRCLVPDLPPVSALVPYLERIEQNRWYSNFGPLLREYENRLGEMTGASRVEGGCVTFSSGTAALELGITALGLAPGSRVLLPAFTFPATLLAVLRCGSEPVLCDVCPETWTLTPDIVLACLQYRDCKLVLPVATFGHPLPADAWDRFSATSDIPVLIDAAAGLGLQQIGRSANVAFSLHATKPLGIGEGGVFVTSDADLAERVRRITNFGFDRGVVTYSGGTNAKLSEYAAAVGLAQLDRWPELLNRRLASWLKYRSALDELPGVRVQAGFDQYPPAVVSVNLSVDASHAASALAAVGIQTRRWYLPPLHHHPSFANIDRIGPHGGTSLPVTEQLARHNLGLPFHTRLSDDNMETIARALGAVLNTN